MLIALPTTRFSLLACPWARVALAVLGLAILAGVLGGTARPHAVRQQVAGAGDGILYEHVVARVAAGEAFYAATVAEQRAVHGSLKPVFAVREPLLATALAAIGPQARTPALRLLCVLVLLAWGRRLLHEQSVGFAVLALLCLASGMLGWFSPQAWPWHEVWAGALMLLALALYDPRRWWLAAGIGLMAALVRELASPFLVAMAAAALMERRWREAAGWGGAILLFVAAMVLHAHLLASYLRPGDATSAGWLALGGWPYVLLLHSAWNVLTLAAPALAAVVVPLMLAGAVGWPGGLGLRLMLLCGGYSAAYLVIGRPDTSYWGLMTAPLTALPLAMVPGALRDLAGKAGFRCRL